MREGPLGSVEVKHIKLPKVKLAIASAGFPREEELGDKAHVGLFTAGERIRGERGVR